MDLFLFYLIFKVGNKERKGKDSMVNNATKK